MPPKFCLNLLVIQLKVRFNFYLAWRMSISPFPLNFPALIEIKIYLELIEHLFGFWFECACNNSNDFDIVALVIDCNKTPPNDRNQHNPYDGRWWRRQTHFEHAIILKSNNIYTFTHFKYLLYIHNFFSYFSFYVTS